MSDKFGDWLIVGLLAGGGVLIWLGLHPSQPSSAQSDNATTAGPATADNSTAPAPGGSSTDGDPNATAAA